MQMLSAEAAIALDRARLLVQLQETARTDDLTGLPNRRAWGRGAAARACPRRPRDSRSVCVAMLDLDRFKRFNDDRGHQAGDRLLKQAASAWASQPGASDMLVEVTAARSSASLLPGCTLDDAQQLVSRLRAAMPDGETNLAGVARWDETESADEFVGRADEALYAAKEAAETSSSRRPRRAQHREGVGDFELARASEQRRRAAARSSRFTALSGRLEDAALDEDSVEVRRRDVVAERGGVVLAQLRERELVRRECEPGRSCTKAASKAPPAPSDDPAVVERVLGLSRSTGIHRVSSGTAGSASLGTRPR